MGHDYLTYKVLDEEKRNTNKIAWVIGIVLAFIVLAIVWATMNKNQQEANNRATDYAFAIGNRVSVLEGNQVVTGEILKTTTSNLSKTMQEAAANATNVAAQGKAIDELGVFRARPYYAGGCATAASGYGEPRFSAQNEYQLCNSRLIERNDCGFARG